MSLLPPWGMEGPQEGLVKEGKAKATQSIMGQCNCGGKLNTKMNPGKYEH